MTHAPGSDDVEPARGGRAHAELVESDTGWTLTVTVDERAARTIRATPADATTITVAIDGLTMSVEPNLVPGEPFQVETVTVRVERR